ncbi:hypothetical protein H6P81_008046 [Aristolochia fimbriata]|uniref:Uncharacterized protein n=1 Tax=Aristolochia fimbriata TaxID=158543 RepID=A0AAV7F578_ARIFI|nr:hypothetical protein H6P81_008046 [Aristolochia fimbriata]
MAATSQKQIRAEPFNNPARRIYAGTSVRSVGNRRMLAGTGVLGSSTENQNSVRNRNREPAARLYDGEQVGAPQNHGPKRVDRAGPEREAVVAIHDRPKLSVRTNVLGRRRYAGASTETEQGHVAESVNGSEVEPGAPNIEAKSLPSRRMFAGYFSGPDRSRSYRVEEGKEFVPGEREDGEIYGAASIVPEKQSQPKPLDTRRKHAGASTVPVPNHVSETPAKGAKAPVTEGMTTNSTWQIRFLNPIDGYKMESREEAFADVFSGKQPQNFKAARRQSSRIGDEASSEDEPYDLEPEMKFNLAFRRGYLEARKKHLDSTFLKTKDVVQQALPVSVAGGFSEPLNLHPEKGFRMGVESWGSVRASRDRKEALELQNTKIGSCPAVRPSPSPNCCCLFYIQKRKRPRTRKVRVSGGSGNVNLFPLSSVVLVSSHPRYASIVYQFCTDIDFVISTRQSDSGVCRKTSAGASIRHLHRYISDANRDSSASLRQRNMYIFKPKLLFIV